MSPFNECASFSSSSSPSFSLHLLLRSLEVWLKEMRKRKLNFPPFSICERMIENSFLPSRRLWVTILFCFYFFIFSIISFSSLLSLYFSLFFLLLPSFLLFSWRRSRKEMRNGWRDGNNLLPFPLMEASAIFSFEKLSRRKREREKKKRESDTWKQWHTNFFSWLSVIETRMRIESSFSLQLMASNWGRKVDQRGRKKGEKEEKQVKEREREVKMKTCCVKNYSLVGRWWEKLDSFSSLCLSFSLLPFLFSFL